MFDGETCVSPSFGLETSSFFSLSFDTFSSSGSFHVLRTSSISISTTGSHRAFSRSGGIGRKWLVSLSP